MAKTIIETEQDSVVLLSRESYDLMRTMLTAANIRNTELAAARDRFEAYIAKDAGKDAKRGYTKYYTAEDVLDIFREKFGIPTPCEPEPEPAVEAEEEGGVE